MTKKKKIVGYCRVSKRGQNDGISLARQKEMIEAYVKFKGLEGEVIFLHDEAQSGYKANRKSFKKLLRLIEREEISHLIVYDLSRLARNVKLTLETVDLMEKHDVVFTSLTENISTDSAIGRCFLVICSAFAQMLRDQVSEKMSDMHEHNRKNGVAGPGFMPYGYKKSGERLIADLDEANTIQLIRILRLQSKTYRQIANVLNAKGITGKRGGQWRAMTVKRIYERSLDVEAA